MFRGSAFPCSSTSQALHLSLWTAALTAAAPSIPPLEECWRQEELRSRFWLCCARREHGTPDDGVYRPDCWAVGIAGGTPEACCDTERIAALETRAAAARLAIGASPCSGAGDEIWGFVEESSENVLLEGQLFMGQASDEGQELQLLADADATYEACAPALLIALLARAARMVAHRGDGWERERDRLIDAYQLWESLRWSRPLCWQNLQDPLVAPGLRAMILGFKVLLAVVDRPEETCSRFIWGMALLLDHAKGLSLTVSDDSAENLHTYPALTKSAMVITTYGHLLLEEPECDPARLIAHVLMARRLLDLRPGIGQANVLAARELTELPHLRTAQAGGSLWSEVLQRLSWGLKLHETWMREARWYENGPGSVNNTSIPTPQPPAGGPSLAPLAIWERTPAPVFSEGMKDPVLERLFGLIGVTNRYYAEVGTQMGDQCNTRYLRVRYGFTGLMLDDHWENVEINQWRHLVTPANIVALFRWYAVPEEFDILSLDTDGNEWLLWRSLQQAGFRPRVVVIEFNDQLPYQQDVLVRYTTFPVHRLCLAGGKFAWLAGGSMAALLALGRHWGYHLVHIITGGTSDMIFVHEDVLSTAGLVFPAQDDLPGLCALAAFQTASPSGSKCTDEWPLGKKPPREELLTTVEAALAGDYEVPGTWESEQLAEMFC